MKIKTSVRVLRRHINEGDTSSYKSCPVALAIKEKGFKSVSVDEITIFFAKNGEFYEGYTPKRTSKFIEKFDDREIVKPFKFTLVAKRVAE